MKTTVLKKSTQADATWYIVDAAGQTLGRLTTQIARVLMGKHKPSYTPNLAGRDLVVVINAAKIKVSGNKMIDKMYYHHSGYPGGIKGINLKEKMQKDPSSVIISAVKGMLPKNKLQDVMLKHLKVYATEEHPHAPQQPIELKVGK